MKPSIGLCLLAYAPHLVEEHATRMHDDPLIVFALRPLSHLTQREAAYMVFQVMMLLALGMTYLWSLGGRARDAVLFAVALALLGESHHVARALASLEYNSGLVTSLPMPFIGALVLRSLFVRRRALAVTGDLFAKEH